MATQHLKLHPLTGNTDHDVTGLVSGQIIYVQNPTNGVQSTGLYTNGSGGLTATTASVTTLSAGTMISGSTNLYSIFQSIGSDTNHTLVQPGTNTTTGGTTALPTVNLVASPSVNSLTVSGTGNFTGTLQSGGTDLYSIFLTTNDGNDITRVQPGSNITTGGTGNNPIVSVADSPSFNALTASGATSLATLSATTMISGSTNLYSIFQSIGSDTNHTQVQNGTNITTGGTTALPTINLVASPSVNGLTVSGTGNFTGTLQSGGTDLYSIFLTTNDGNDITRVQPGSNITTGGTGNNPIVSVADSPSFNALTASGSTSLATLSATTMISGSTNLYSIFQSIGSDTNHTQVQNGTNTTTGGTTALPTVNIVASPSFNNVTFSGTAIGGNVQAAAVTATSLSATTISGGTLYSGSTNLYSIFLTAANVSASTVSAGSNVTVNNVGLDYNVSVVASPSFNNLTVSGTGNFTGTLQSGGTDLYSIFAGAGTGVQSVSAGSNITIGGTATNPIVNVDASPSFNGLSVSGTADFTGTLQSGGTDLNSIYVQGNGTTNVLPLWTGTRLIGNSIITQSGSGVTVAGSVNIIGDVNVLGTASTFNTQTVQSLDNNISLNFSGSYVSAFGGGITVLSGNSNGSPSSWSIDANGSWSSNTAILTSAITVNGGIINVTGGGLMQSGSTNLYSIFATAGQDYTTASNGLTLTGYDVALGGTLSSPTTIGLGGNALQISGEGASSTTVAWSGAPFYTRLLVNGSGSQLKTTFGTFGDNYFQASDSTTMNYTDGGAGTSMRMRFDGTNMYVTDAVNSRGLEYLQDYSPQFVNNSLVTKLYVDTAITGVTSGLVETVTAGSNITTGGTASNPIINLVASPSVNNLTVSGNTTAQGISGTTIYASQFFQMTPYTGSNPSSPNNNDVWFHSGATGTITLNYRIGGVTKGVELS